MLPLACFAPPFFFFFNDTATTEIYTLSLHDALPICIHRRHRRVTRRRRAPFLAHGLDRYDLTMTGEDRKSTRLNSSHGYISYAVFCLQKKQLQLSCSTAVRIKSAAPLSSPGP